VTDRGTRLDPNWEPSPKNIAFAESIGCNWKWEAPKFKAYWLSKAGAGATKLDWDMTWDNWARKAVERMGGPVIASAVQSITKPKESIPEIARRLGYAWAITPSGARRQLRPGDALRPGERLAP